MQELNGRVIILVGKSRRAPSWQVSVLNNGQCFGSEQQFLLLSYTHTDSLFFLIIIYYTVNVCDWDGVECDHSGTRITIIQLTESGLAATIPSELGQLPYLERLHLDNLIPDGSGLTGTIPSELASLTNLVDVNLAFNGLTGTLPTFASAKLQTLNLSTNALVGPVPTEFYYGSKGHGYMLCLDLSQNSLTGTISEAIGQLQKLETMSLSDNQFSGTIPASIGVLRDLRYVYLNNNHLQGTFPADFVNPDAQLSEVWFQSNLLSGTVSNSSFYSLLSCNE